VSPAQSNAATEVIVDLLASGHAVRFRAGGDSMHPIIRGDDYLHVKPLTSRIRRGDVVLTLANRGLTAHRVIAMKGESLVTRGDNAPADDAPVERARVLGVVTHAERAGRTRRIPRATAAVLQLRRLIARALA
jgi:signal peptidase I